MTPGPACNAAILRAAMTYRRRRQAGPGRPTGPQLSQPASGPTPAGPSIEVAA
jgi:hypothetical protein